MPDELTLDDLIKAIKCCVAASPCSDCPLNHDRDNCGNRVLIEARRRLEEYRAMLKGA